MTDLKFHDNSNFISHGTKEMTIEAARERLKDAVGILVDERAGIKERLMIAYVSQLSRIDADRDLPARLSSEFERIRFTLATDEGAGDRGTVSKELKRISDDEASQIAREIFSMFLEVLDLQETVDTDSV